jgi:hypothetical protein
MGSASGCHALSQQARGVSPPTLEVSTSGAISIDLLLVHGGKYLLFLGCVAWKDEVISTYFYRSRIMESADQPINPRMDRRRLRGHA